MRARTRSVKGAVTERKFRAAPKRPDARLYLIGQGKKETPWNLRKQRKTGE